MRVLASIVHHFDWIKTLARTSTDHPFNAILLVYRNLVDKLKVLVTIEKSDVVSKATGIPPHIKQSIKLQKSTTCLELLQNQAVHIKQVRMRDLIALFFK